MGEPVQIVRPKLGRGFELDKGAVRKILVADNIKDKPVVVISVAGAFRTGKSFLLNFFLRYMHSSREQDWLSDRYAPLEGFSWSGGSERHTTGIWLWNEAFQVKSSQGDEVAVLLMDTHGMFDSDTAIKDCLSMFVFSASVSSVQLYNITHNIQEDDLQRLQTCVEYGRVALAKKENDCLFQNLLFLVRDWNFPSEAPYGENGGKYILNRWLKTFGLQPPELKDLRENIVSAFSAIGCFLLPHPGRQVATATSTDNRICEMEDDFRDSIKDLVSSLLEPDKLVFKKACGRQLTCEDLARYIEECMEAVWAKVPEPTSTLEVCGALNTSVPPCDLSSRKSGLRRRNPFIYIGMKPDTGEPLPKEEDLPHKMTVCDSGLGASPELMARRPEEGCAVKVQEQKRMTEMAQSTMGEQVLVQKRVMEMLQETMGKQVLEQKRMMEMAQSTIGKQVLEQKRMMEMAQSTIRKQVREQERMMQMLLNSKEEQDMMKQALARRKVSDLEKRLADEGETKRAEEAVEELKKTCLLM